MRLLQPAIAWFPTLRKRLFPPDAKPPAKNFTFNSSLDSKKQAQLENLCEQLLKNADFVNSGKLQLVGLSEIKKRLGNQWNGLSRLVYNTVEEVIETHLNSDDLSIRYRDEIYLILFLTAPFDEAQKKIAKIAHEIRQRLFTLDEKELRRMEIQEATHVISADAMSEFSFSDFLDAYVADDNHFDCLLKFKKAKSHDPTEQVSRVDVNAKDINPESDLKPLQEPIEVTYAYQPLWEVKRNAITTYLCEALDVTNKRNLFNAYNSTSNQTMQHKLSLDLEILKNTLRELELMEKEGRKVLISCPVQYQTLHGFESYQQYKNVLQTIPDYHRQFLIFHVVDTEENMPIKETYWFAKPLRQFCRFVFAEVPLRRDINFSFLQKTGVNVAGVRLRDNVEDEAEMIRMLNSFTTRAKSLNIPQTFIFGANTLSIATSAVCAGFDFIGGKSILNKQTKPGGVQQFHVGNLVNGMLKEGMINELLRH